MLVRNYYFYIQAVIRLKLHVCAVVSGVINAIEGEEMAVVASDVSSQREWGRMEPVKKRSVKRRIVLVMERKSDTHADGETAG